MIRTDFYVYIYFRPNGTPCYVGKGCGKRWKKHCHRDCSNPRLAKIIADAGENLPIVIIRRGLSNDEARSIEIAFIAAISRGRNGPLVNMTDGGEGLAGTSMPEEIRQKISISHKGRKFSPEHRANISKARIAMFAERKAQGQKTTLSDEHREAIRHGKLGKAMSAEACAAMSAAKKGKPCGEIQRIRLTEYARNKTPAHRAKLAELCRIRNQQGEGP